MKDSQFQAVAEPERDSSTKTTGEQSTVNTNKLRKQLKSLKKEAEKARKREAEQARKAAEKAARKEAEELAEALMRKQIEEQRKGRVKLESQVPRINKCL